MSQPRNFLLPGENETMHQIMQEHYKKTGQLDKLDPLADPVDLDFDPTEPMGLGFSAKTSAKRPIGVSRD